MRRDKIYSIMDLTINELVEAFERDSTWAYKPQPMMKIKTWKICYLYANNYYGAKLKGLRYTDNVYAAILFFRKYILTHSQGDDGKPIDIFTNQVESIKKRNHDIYSTIVFECADNLLNDASAVLYLQEVKGDDETSDEEEEKEE